MSEDSFIGDAELARMRQAEKDHPATEHTNAGGWCKHCGCGNDILGNRHLPACSRPKSRPRAFLDWAILTFGPIANNPEERLTRFLEEAVELCHANGMSHHLLSMVVARVYAKAPGETPKELGQVQACLETFAECIGLSSDDECAREFERVKTIPRDEWKRRHAAKVAIGIAR